MGADEPDEDADEEDEEAAACAGLRDAIDSLKIAHAFSRATNENLGTHAKNVSGRKEECLEGKKDPFGNGSD